MEYNIKGGMNTFTGDVDWLEVHAGAVYLKGQVKTLVHTGGVIYDQRPSNRVEYRTDHISDEERSRYRRRIAELENRLSRSEAECLNLRKKLNSSSVRLPEDDVLVAKIEHLQIELNNERKGRKQEVSDLKERLNVAMEINAKLRHETDRDKISQEIADRHIDILATLMSLYPFTPTEDLEFEFGIPRNRIAFVANMLKTMKSTEARREAVEYLKKQHIEFIQRRGGNMGKYNEKPVEQIGKRGKVLASFDNAKEAAKATGYSERTVRTYCRSRKKTFTKEGYTFRYKDT